MNEKICNIIKNIAKEQNGSFNTNIKGVKVFYLNEHSPRKYLEYDASIVIVFQGKKIGYLNKKEIHYGANNYLILAGPLPFECESLGTKNEPLLGISVKIDSMILQEIWNSLDKITLMNGIKKSTNASLAQASPTSKEIENSVFRLLTSANEKETAKIFGKDTIKELYYQILKDKNGSLLFTLADKGNHLTKITETLLFINQNLSENITIEQMAEISNMSASNFHRLFKKTTGNSPLQFVKKAKLSKAKNLIEQQNLRVNIAAQKVGYESSSQFSREFKRLFGFPPKICIETNNKN